MTLLDLSVGQVAFVEKILLGNHGEGLVNRMEAMGIIPDKPIQLLRKASLGGPLHLRIGSTTEVAMRRSEAQLVQITLGE
ncbi:ferrous iron transport protein A [Synechocystis sp. PCC 7338]|uniref:FeoA family protein n=1 Tax=Synechocystis sp. PCC 7338 TaxID=2732530 RepID=UPI001BAFBDCB|nr:ferrous iron transport protein A [Synechocystis sp. PCC 7338]QUS60184.1 ferrous iron transport protein A [Synechocystis sp. PCC 7338]